MSDEGTDQNAIGRDHVSKERRHITEAIGEVIIAGAVLEYVVADLCWLLMDSPIQKARLATGNMQFDGLKRLALALVGAEHGLAPVRPTLEMTLKKAAKLMGDRGRIAHLVLIEAAGNRHYAIHRKGDRRPRILKLEELNQITADIEGCASDLSRVNADIKCRLEQLAIPPV